MHKLTMAQSSSTTNPILGLEKVQSTETIIWRYLSVSTKSREQWGIVRKGERLTRAQVTCCSLHTQPTSPCGASSLVTTGFREGDQFEPAQWSCACYYRSLHWYPHFLMISYYMWHDLQKGSTWCIKIPFPSTCHIYLHHIMLCNVYIPERLWFFPALSYCDKLS